MSYTVPIRQKGLGAEPTNKEIAMRSIIEHGIVSRELFNFVCGDFLGYGISRMVFVYRPKPQWVIKIEIDNYNANVIEHHNWQAVMYNDDMAKWFAPCGEMSACGRILLQRRCKPARDYDSYPDKVPIFMTDLKYKNWGVLNGHHVCFDYAGCLLTQYGHTKKMKKALWWEHDVMK